MANVGESVGVDATLLKLDVVNAALQPSHLTRALRAIVPTSGMPDIVAGDGGDVVVLSDPQPAILGMALAPVAQD